MINVETVEKLTKPMEKLMAVSNIKAYILTYSNKLFMYRWY